MYEVSDLHMPTLRQARDDDWAQVDAAVALYPRVVDPESFHRVVGALAFSSDRAELRRRIRD